MAHEKVGAILNMLSVRTQSGKIDWQQTAQEGVYQVSLPKYTVQIYTRPSEHPDAYDYVLAIRNDVGAVIEEVADVEFDDAAATYQLMRKMYDAARSKALGVDAALDEILLELREK